MSIRCSPEADEPNQNFAQAAMAECGVLKEAFLAPQTDVDFYRMIGVSGSTVSVDIDAAQIGSTLDPVLGIFDNSFGLLGLSDDDGAPGEGTTIDSYVEVTVPADGVLYIAVSSFFDTSTVFKSCSSRPASRWSLRSFPCAASTTQSDPATTGFKQW